MIVNISSSIETILILKRGGKSSAPGAGGTIALFIHLPAVQYPYMPTLTHSRLHKETLGSHFISSNRWLRENRFIGA